MKKLIMAALLAAMAVGTQAQDTGHRRGTATGAKKNATHRSQTRTERMAKELGLDAAQQARVEALNAQYAKEAEAREARAQAAREARLAEARARQEAYEAELKTILTAEQFATWQKKMEAGKEKHKVKRKEKREQRRGSVTPVE